MTPVSTGPYKVESYVEKKSLVLVRNDKWAPASDPVRKAYPDKIVVQFSLNPQVIDQRLKQSSGDDASAIGDPIDAADLDAIFKDTSLADRVSNQGTPFTRYIAINAKKVPNVKQRQALMAALDREAYRKLSGGDYAGDYADGAINANLGQDYAPTGLWDTVLGAAVPATGDIALAKKLIADSGEPPVAITYDYGKAKNDNTADKAAAIIKTSWEKAGFKVTLNPIERSKYYGVVLDEAKQGSASVSGWGPDWLNASTVIPPLFKPDGGFDLSHYGDAGFQAKIVAASATLDRGAQAKAWQELNTEVVKAGLIIPTWFDKEQLIFGTKVKTVAGGGKPYSNSAFAGAPFADLYVTK
jgi:peptide/nickel transport system substrate-binding protein